MSPGERASTLAHDVGKYVARIARNVPAGAAVPAALVPLLARDLYEGAGGSGGQRPSVRFAQLAEGLEAPRLARAGSLLREIDALEAAVRAGEPEACRRACALAVAVEAELRAHAAEVPR